MAEIRSVKGAWLGHPYAQHRWCSMCQWHIPMRNMWVILHHSPLFIGDYPLISFLFLSSLALYLGLFPFFQDNSLPLASSYENAEPLPSVLAFSGFIHIGSWLEGCLLSTNLNLSEGFEPWSEPLHSSLWPQKYRWSLTYNGFAYNFFLTLQLCENNIHPVGTLLQIPILEVFHFQYDIQ